MDNESYDFIFKIVLLGDSGVGKCCYYLEMAMNIVNIFVQDSESILFQYRLTYVFFFIYRLRRKVKLSISIH